jgi:hypothetical protein
VIEILAKWRAKNCLACPIEKELCMKATIIAAAVLLSITVAVFAQGPPGSVPAKNGQASFKFDNAPVSFGAVNGTFMQSSGFSVITLNFSKDGKPGSDHLGISLMIQKAGPVDLNQPMGNGIGYWKSGTIISYAKGKSKCTVNVTKLTPTSVEGTAECPAINENSGSGTHSLTGANFSASSN